MTKTFWRGKVGTYDFGANRLRWENTPWTNYLRSRDESAYVVAYKDSAPYNEYLLFKILYIIVSAFYSSCTSRSHGQLTKYVIP